MCRHANNKIRDVVTYHNPLLDIQIEQFHTTADVLEALNTIAKSQENQTKLLEDQKRASSTKEILLLSMTTVVILLELIVIVIMLTA